MLVLYGLALLGVLHVALALELLLALRLDVEDNRGKDDNKQQDEVDGHAALAVINVNTAVVVHVR